MSPIKIPDQKFGLKAEEIARSAAGGEAHARLMQK